MLLESWSDSSAFLIIVGTAVAVGTSLLLLLFYRLARKTRERARFEDALRCSEARFRGISQLTHEINQPLAAIVSYANGCARRLRSGNVAPDELLRVVEEIAAQAARADEIVRRLRELPRSERSQREAAGE